MAPSGRFKMGDGDWVCSDPECANVNFARRTSCNRCKKDKPAELFNQFGTEIGKAAAERSRGLFSAEDWQCTKCGNINWARRHTCNMCNSPKVGDVEERTGYGGGFNERGNVEYIHRDESDGEYDEFGRKKKKYRGPKSSEQSESSKPTEDSKKKHEETVKEPDPVKESDEEEEEEEEDDDDDDDEDVSKYDLSGWGDDDDDEEEKKDDDTHNKDSDSRSRSQDQSKEEQERARSRSPITRS